MSQGDIVKIIPAGFENFEIRAGGDFVFIKECARDIIVTIDDSPIKMTRGDKRRVERKELDTQAFTTFQVTNKYDFDLRVVMVVGDGDYQSQIVTGELSVSAYVKTLGNDVSKTTTAPLSKTFLINSVGEVERLQGQTLYTVNVNNNQLFNDKSGTSAATYHNGSFYKILVFNDHYMLVSFNEKTANNTFDTEQYIATKLPDLSGGGNIWGICFDDRGNLYADHGGNIYIKRVGESVFKLFNSSAFLDHLPYRRSATKLFFKDGYLIRSSYYGGRSESRGLINGHEYTNNDFEVLNVKTGEFRVQSINSISDKLHGNIDNRVSGHELGLRSYSGINQEESILIFKNGTFVDVIQTSKRPSLGVQDHTSDDGIYGFRDNGNNFWVTYAQTYKAFGNISLVDEYSNINIDLLEPPNIYKKNGIDILGFDFLKLFFSRFLRITNYLDFVTLVEYNDGEKTVHINTGTATFAFRGVDYSYIEIANNTKIKIGYLPNV